MFNEKQSVIYNKISDVPEIYSFKGNLYAFLLSIGVSAEHITRMQKKLIKECIYELYDPVDKHPSEMIQPIDVKKVVGVRRAKPSVSVFDNIQQFERSDFNPSKMEDCLSYACDLPYDKLLQSYAQLPDPVGTVMHIIDTDEYYMVGEHNHTTMCAMIFNAPTIIAKVKEYRLNTAKAQKYEALERFYQKYGIKRMGINGQHSVRVIFNGSCCIYYVDYDMSKCEWEFYAMLDRLGEAIENDYKKVTRYLHLPCFIQRVLNPFIRNTVKQHMDTKLFEPEDLLRFGYHEPQYYL